VIKLIPRMKDWVAAYYPGTKIGITDTTGRGKSHQRRGGTGGHPRHFRARRIGSATPLDHARIEHAAFKAMKMYRNYDGNDSTFGDTSVSATGPNPDNVSAFARCVRLTEH